MEGLCDKVHTRTWVQRSVHHQEPRKRLRIGKPGDAPLFICRSHRSHQWEDGVAKHQHSLTTVQRQNLVSSIQQQQERVARSLCANATSTSSQAAAQPSQKRNSKKKAEATTESQRRTRRLEILIALRKMYRNVLRAQGLLSQPSPLYETSQQRHVDTKPTSKAAREAKAKRSALAAANNAGASNSMGLDEDELERRATAIEIVAELQLTAEQLKADIRSLSAVYGSFGDIFGDASSDKEEHIIKLARGVAEETARRSQTELQLLPYRLTSEAQAAIDARNARYKSASERESQKARKDGSEGDSRELKERLSSAEKAVEKFVAQRIQPAVRKVTKTPVSSWGAGVKGGANYVRGVWTRLNGGGRRTDGLIDGLPEELQMPAVDKEARSAATKTLSLEIANLEKQLQESSKAREQRVRKAGMSERARMAGQLRLMDDEVLVLSRSLAVKTLQLEMEYIHAALEDEAVDVAQGTKDAGFLLSRTGSSDEVALLIAEFGLLDQQLAALQDAIDNGQARLLDEDQLDGLAPDISDLRARLGIGEAIVFSGSSWTLVKVQAVFAEGIDKVKEGALFFSRGVRLLGSDISSAGRLFSRAVLGTTLKNREVQAIRRTFRDVLTFFPFIIILIAPITPVGHVLVFSFIQRYFPSFFPTQFSTRRQELMIRYEDLKTQLQAAQEAALAEDDEAELRRATAAVARLTAPSASVSELELNAVEDMAGTIKINGKPIEAKKALDSAEEGPANKALRDLKQQVAAAAEQRLAMKDEESR